MSPAPADSSGVKVNKATSVLTGALLSHTRCLHSACTMGCTSRAYGHALGHPGTCASLRAATESHPESRPLCISRWWASSLGPFPALSQTVNTAWRTCLVIPGVTDPRSRKPGTQPKEGVAVVVGRESKVHTPAQDCLAPPVPKWGLCTSLFSLGLC